MYPSLIAAGASQLYDLYKNVTGGSSSASTSFDPSSSTPGVGATDPVSPAGTSGSKFSDALQKLFTDLQSNSSDPATASTSIASDLKSVAGAAKGANGHHHHGPPPAQSPGVDGDSADSASSTSGTGSLQNVASSLLAYVKNQSLTNPAGAASLTA